jgi:hypothetical protein
MTDSDRSTRKMPKRLKWFGSFGLSGMLGMMLPVAAQTPLTPLQTPPGSNFFTVVQSDTLTGTGIGNAKVYSVDVEGGDYVTLQVRTAGVGTYPKLRLRTSGNTVVASHDGTQPGEAWVQNYLIPAPGTYNVQVYSDHVAGGFTLRVDIGRGFPLELEANDIAAAGSRLAAVPNGGGFTAKLAGALDYSDDYFELGTFASGNSLALSLGLPSTSTMASGDIEMTIFKEGAEATPAASGSSSPLNHTIAESGNYFLRVKPSSLAGRALRFDGTDDQVNLGNPAALRITGDQTIEMWLKPDDFAARRNPFAKAYGGEGTFTIETDGTVNYFYGTGGGNTSPYAAFLTTRRLVAGQWNHLAVVRNLSTAPQKVFLYVNGMPAGEFPAPYFPAVASGLDALIGNGYVGRFKGEIDELRIWNVPRTAAELAGAMDESLTGSEAGLVAYYKFEEGSGTTLVDATANDLDGTITGNPVWTGTPAAAAFAPARQGLRAQYVGTLTVTDGQPPSVVSTFLTAAQGASYDVPGLLYNLSNMVAYRGQNGSTFNVQLTGAMSGGSVWGTGLFTDDSFLRMAVVHAGLLVPGETGIVTVTVQPGQASYFGSSRNGIASSDYPAYVGSYSLSRYTPPAPPTLNGVYNSLRITFSEWMNPSTLQSPANFELRHAGPNGTLDNADDLLYPLSAPGYTGDSSSAYFTISNGPLQPGLYRLKVLPSVQDRSGVGLTPAEGYSETFTILPFGNFAIENRSNDTRDTATLLTPPSSGFDGSFGTGIFRAAGDHPWGIQLLDLNADGNKEALVAGYTTATLRVFPGNADGTFGASTDYAAGTNPWDVETLDIDNDGDQDVAVSCYGNDRVYLFTNPGNGTLTSAGFVVVGDGPTHMAKGNFDGGSFPDLAVANYNTSTGGRSISVLLGNGAGGFTESKITVSGQSFRPYGVAVGDVDGDGDSDIAATDWETDDLAIFRNNGGTWAVPTLSPLDDADPTGVSLADFDHDGILDAAAVTEYHDHLSVLKGIGDGTFQSFQRIYLGGNAYQYFVETPDLDGDGWADLVIPRSSGFVVHYNRQAATAPSFSGAGQYSPGYITAIASSRRS